MPCITMPSESPTASDRHGCLAGDGMGVGITGETTSRFASLTRVDLRACDASDRFCTDMHGRPWCILAQAPKRKVCIARWSRWLAKSWHWMGARVGPGAFGGAVRKWSSGLRGFVAGPSGLGPRSCSRCGGVDGGMQRWGQGPHAGGHGGVTGPIHNTPPARTESPSYRQDCLGEGWSDGRKARWRPRVFGVAPFGPGLSHPRWIYAPERRCACSRRPTVR